MNPSKTYKTEKILIDVKMATSAPLGKVKASMDNQAMLSESGHAARKRSSRHPRSHQHRNLEKQLHIKLTGQDYKISA